MDGWKMNFLLGRLIFRGYVSFWRVIASSTHENRVYHFPNHQRKASSSNGKISSFRGELLVAGRVSVLKGCLFSCDFGAKFEN